jgi:Predicted double-glycine peptidase
MIVADGRECKPMRMVGRCLGCVLFLHSFMVGVSMAGEGDVAFPTMKRHTLKELRDQYVVKQGLDYSCGAAVLATLMSYYFGDETAEKEILELLNTQLAKLTKEQWAHKKRIGFSLLDLKKVAEQKGYRAAGFTLTLDQLRQLVAPVIVFIRPFGYHHFSVLRGVAGDRVFLADPARGNLRLGIGRFLDEWDGSVFVLGKAGEEKITTYPLSLSQPGDYPQPRLRRVGHMGSQVTAFTIDLAVRSRPQ